MSAHQEVLLSLTLAAVLNESNLLSNGLEDNVRSTDAAPSLPRSQIRSVSLVSRSVRTRTFFGVPGPVASDQSVAASPRAM